MNHATSIEAAGVPTEPGWYWARCQQSNSPWRPVKVTFYGGVVVAQQHGTVKDAMRRGWEFRGPILPPS